MLNATENRTTVPFHDIAVIAFLDIASHDSISTTSTDADCKTRIMITPIPVIAFFGSFRKPVPAHGRLQDRGGQGSGADGLNDDKRTRLAAACGRECSADTTRLTAAYG